MKQKLRAFFLAGLLLSAAFLFSIPSQAQELPLLKMPLTGYLTKVEYVRTIDGDTIEIRKDNQNFTIRLLGVDTPETVHPSKPIEYYGPEASIFTEDYLDRQDLYLEFDGDMTDKYGRVLAYIWLENGTLFNLILVEQGYAKLYENAKNLKYEDFFLLALKEAQDGRIGMWEQVEVEVKATPKPTAKPTSKPKTTPKPTKKPTATAEPTAKPTNEPPTEVRVVIAPLSGTKYHKSSKCSGLRNAKSTKTITLSAAEEQGYGPCGICY